MRLGGGGQAPYANTESSRISREEERVLSKQSKEKRSLSLFSLLQGSDLGRQGRGKAQRRGPLMHTLSRWQPLTSLCSLTPPAAARQTAISLKPSFWGQLCEYYSPLAATETAAREQ